MAVRHGYGKIAGADALVFAYDTGDTRNSYRGEPTVNLVTNGNFSNGITGWSYNGSAASYSEVNTFEGRTVFKSNGLTTYSDRGYIYQTISGLTSGATYTISFDYYIISGQLTYDPDSASNNNATFTSPTGVWKTHTDTFTAASTAVTLNFWGINGNPGYFYITNIQCELKSHKTPFVNGTRSATQGLLDLTGNYTVDISNMSFDSNAKVYSDGSNDIITISNDILNSGNELTLEFWITDHITWGNNTVLIYGENSGNQCINIHLPWGDGNIYWDCGNSGQSNLGDRIYKSISQADLEASRHWVFTKNATSGYMAIYKDGELWHSGTGKTRTMTGITTSTLFNVSSLSYDWGGAPDAVKVYHRALTAAEVKNNYNFGKGRFV